MKRNIKVVEINGFRGFFVVAYAIICAAAGFILFPAWLLMILWNAFSMYIYNLPHMSLIHGFLLYLALILLYFATNTNKSGLNISSVNMNNSSLAAMMNDIDDKK